MLFYLSTFSFYASLIAKIMLVFFIAVLIITFFCDLIQVKNPLYHNYPLIGHLRPIFIKLGVFFRDYFSIKDWEGLPFSRGAMEYISKSSKGADMHLQGFGSTKKINLESDVIFASAIFPVEVSEGKPAARLIIGPLCANPYSPNSFFNISAMSYGALSEAAVRALSRGAKLAECFMNTGEGGLSKHHLEGGCDIIYQMGTAKYGARTEEGHFCPERFKIICDHEEVKMIELKLSQGAKPGKGGILPGEKVTKEIAEMRFIPEGQDSISPNRHEEISNTGELLDFIAKLKKIGGKPVGFKTVISHPGWLDEFCEEVKKRDLKDAPDFITVDGGEGGTGAAPILLLHGVGMPIKQALPMVVDKITQHNLRDRIKIIASGKLVTALEVAWALAQGADYINSARGFMFALGCIQSLRCDSNTCPTGITTHNKYLQKALRPQDKAVHVANYVKSIITEVEMISHSCGAISPRHLNRENLIPNYEDNSVFEMFRKLEKDSKASAIS